MTNERSLLASGLGKVFRNKRYIVWFYLTNLVLAALGIAAFHSQAQAMLDRSLLSSQLVHGFNLTVLIEMLAQPEFGPASTASMSGVFFAIPFFLVTALFLPGVFQGYASTYRLPREDFFRACGRNLWRYIRLMIIAAIVMGVLFVLLLVISVIITNKATESTNEVLPFEVRMLGLFIIFLVMTTLRIWFDLSEVDVVLNDQRAVRRSIYTAFGHTFRNLGRLLLSYVVAAVFATAVLVAGIWAWVRLIAPEKIFSAILLSQFTLLLLLIPRFWQRGMAVSYWQQKMMVPVVAVQPLTPVPAPAPVLDPITPEPSPLIPAPPPPPDAT